MIRMITRIELLHGRLQQGCRGHPYRNQDNLFLDDMSLAEFIRKSGREVKIAQGAAELYNLLLRQPLPHNGTAGRNSVPERKGILTGNNTEYVKQFS